MSVISFPAPAYELHGVRITSEFPIDGGNTADSDGDAEVDLTIVRGIDRGIPLCEPPGKVIARSTRRDDPTKPFYTAVRADEGYLLRFHGCCDVEVDESISRVVCHLDPEADLDRVVVYVTGIALAFVFGLLDYPVLHASAVALAEFNGDVVAVAGRPGSGKSTVTALLCAAGCEFVTDDLLRLDFHERRAFAVGGCTELRLRSGARGLIDSFGSDRPATRVSGDGRLALRLSRRPHDSAPVRAIVVPWPDRQIARVSVEPVEASESLLAFSSYPRFEGWIDPTVLAMQFDAFAKLVAEVPVFCARIPWMPAPTVTGACELVDALAGEIG